MKIILTHFLFLLFIPLFAQQTVGVFLNDKEAFNGYTLLAPTSSTSTYLIDNCGQVINSWSSNYRPGEVAYLIADGQMLRACRFPGSFNGGGVGGRLEWYDWEGNMVWAYNYANAEHHQHHDVEVLPNGNILLMAWESRSKEEAIAMGRDSTEISNQGVWPEQIIELEPVGDSGANIVWEWHLWDHLIQDFDPGKPNFGEVAEHPELFDINYRASRFETDWIHANSLDYNPELDQIILNSRNMNEFWIIDHSTTTAEAASHSGGNSGKGGDLLYRWGNPQTYDRGDADDQRLFGQHDVNWIPQGYPGAGQIMIFNNGQGRPAGNFSSIDVIQAPVDANGHYSINAQEAYGPTSLAWNYIANPATDFYSGRISGAQRMPNGNTLICEGINGHVFEVDENGSLVWDYLIPIGSNGPITQGTTTRPSGLFRAYRYAPDDPILSWLELTAGNVLEVNPLPSDCELFNSTTISTIPTTSIQLLNNPIGEALSIKNPEGHLLRYAVYDLAGRKLSEGISRDFLINKNTSNWTKGMYILQIQDTRTQQLITHKIIR